MIIEKVNVETTTRYGKGGNFDQHSILRLSMPIPGGNCVFEYDITDQQKEALEKAAQLK